MRDIFIGSGFWSSTSDHEAKTKFLYESWAPNCWRYYPCGLLHGDLVTFPKVCVIDNSENGLKPAAEIIRIVNNLGRNTDIGPNHSRLLGWSMSWIIPALIAYSENCDFVYKEQDCMVFGNWLPEIVFAKMTVGRSSTMPCEQSLFWMARDFIPDFVSAYLAHPDRDNQTMTEDKMVQVGRRFGGQFQFHDLPFGRERPLEYYTDRPWYAQRITADELQHIKSAGLA